MRKAVPLPYIDYATFIMINWLNNYHNMLIKWTGETSQFTPLTNLFPLCEAIFRYNNICESN